MYVTRPNNARIPALSEMPNNPCEAVVLEAKDWKTKSTPYRVADYIAKRHGWKFEQGRMPDGSGWRSRWSLTACHWSLEAVFNQ
jgi:hypothetical protein